MSRVCVYIFRCSDDFFFLGCFDSVKYKNGCILRNQIQLSRKMKKHIDSILQSIKSILEVFSFFISFFFLKLWSLKCSDKGLCVCMCVYRMMFRCSVQMLYESQNLRQTWEAVFHYQMLFLFQLFLICVKVTLCELCCSLFFL